MAATKNIIVEKSFLQTLMGRGSLSLPEAHDVFNQLSEKQKLPRPSREQFEKHVKQMNTELAETNHAVALVQHPLSPAEPYVVFYTKSENNNAKMHVHVSEVERVLFNKVLDALMDAPDLKAPWTIGYSVGDSLPGNRLSKQAIQSWMKTWTEEGYFLDVDDHITLGPRMIIEFGSYIERNYPDVATKCPLCMKSVLWSISCHACGVKVHSQCLKIYMRKKSKCPSCPELWSVPPT